MKAKGVDDQLREKRRDAPASVVLACFRLTKACQIHDDANQTVQQLVPDVLRCVSEYCELFSVETVRLMFSREVVFVNRRLMRGQRETYGIALQLGELLAHANANEVTIERTLDSAAALRFARLVVDAQRSPEAANGLTEAEIQGIVVRKVPEADEFEEERKDGPIARVVKAYAASILILQGFYRKLGSSGSANAQSVKRIAQKLVAVSEQHPELLVAAAAAALGDASPGRRAVSSAVLSIAMTRKLSMDRALATSAAQSALLLDLGATLSESGASPQLLGGSAMAYLLHTGGLHPLSLRRAAITHQVLSGDATDPTHSLALAQIVRVATRFNALRAPGKETSSLDGAMDKLQAECKSATDAPYLRLLVSALGLVPTGTIVELSSGEVAMVTGVPRQALDFARPRVRVLTDANHAALKTPLELDLARPKPGEPERAVKRAIVGAGLTP